VRRLWVASQSYQAAVDRLVSLRIEKQLSQRDLAERLEKPRSFVSKIETKARRLDIVELIAYARALDLSPGALADEIARAVGDRPEI